MSAVERARRVEDAIHSGRMDGLDVTSATCADAQEYAEGKISARELRARVRARYDVAPAAGDPAPASRRRRVVRFAAIGVLTADVLAASVVGAIRLHHSDPAPHRDVVVDSRCIDGRITQGIDDGNPAGILATDTGVPC